MTNMLLMRYHMHHPRGCTVPIPVCDAIHTGGRAEWWSCRMPAGVEGHPHPSWAEASQARHIKQ